MKPIAAKYRLRGTRRRPGREGSEPFDTIVIAASAHDAEFIVRENWRGAWESVRISHVGPAS